MQADCNNKRFSFLVSEQIRLKNRISYLRDAVVSGNMMLKASQNKYDWLGYGFYFWQNNYERALDFATNPPGKKEYASETLTA